MKNSKLFIVVFFLSILSSYGQIQKGKKGLILTYKIKKVNHNSDLTYYWFIPEESINVSKDKFEIYPFYLDTFSKDNLDDCLNNESIDLFVSTKKTNYNFDLNYKKSLENLKVKLKSNSLIIQSIVNKRKYPRKEKKEIKISISFVQGDFAFCSIKNKMAKKINGYSKIVLPVSPFSFNQEGLKESKLIEFIYQTDFSQLEYSNNLNY